MSAQSDLSRRTFLKGTAASAAALALPSGLLMAKDRRPLSPRGTPAPRATPSPSPSPGSPNNYAATVKLLAGFTKNTGITITPVSYNNTGGWVQTFQEYLSTGSRAAYPSTVPTSPPKECCCSRSKACSRPSGRLHRLGHDRS